MRWKWITRRFRWRRLKVRVRTLGWVAGRAWRRGARRIRRVSWHRPVEVAATGHRILMIEGERWRHATHCCVLIRLVPASLVDWMWNLKIVIQIMDMREAETYEYSRVWSASEFEIETPWQPLTISSINYRPKTSKRIIQSKRWVISGLWKLFPQPPTPPKKESVWLRQIAVINGIIFFASTTTCYASRTNCEWICATFHATCLLILPRPTLQPWKQYGSLTLYIPYILRR
jgi:hypothetical protein